MATNELGNSTLDLIQTYGPPVFGTCLLMAMAYYFWNRQILKGVVSFGMAVFSFILGVN